jgi:hypothetical protein
LISAERRCAHYFVWSAQVTLMQHFKNYLDETHPNRDSPSHPSPTNLAGDDGAGVYVRKWMRTRHSIIFRLSNNSFQVPPRAAPAAPRCPPARPSPVLGCRRSTALNACSASQLSPAVFLLPLSSARVGSLTRRRR